VQKIWVVLFCLIAIVGFLFFSKDPRSWIDKTVDREFALYRHRGISLPALEKAWRKLRRHPEFRRYKIIQSKVYGQPGRIKNLLQLLVDQGPIPDVDFLYFHEDRIKKSHARRSGYKDPVPIFVSAKDISLPQLILFSDWLYDPTDTENGWNAHISLINALQTQWPWAAKTDQLFWRGSPFDGTHFGMYDFDNWKTIPRGRLVHQSRLHPDLINAAFSAYPHHCFTQDPERTLREMGPQSYVPIADQLQYKYHLLIDGVTCTFPGTHWKLLSGSVPFKQQSPDILYFYRELIPWKHYIPVRHDLSDLPAKIRWAQEHDAEARAIANQARTFALTHLMPEHILAYCRAILLRYASLQHFEPTLEPYGDDTGRQF
jgi:hypothetical protein